SMNQQASASQASGYENNVLAAIVVGGVSMRGGSGSIQNAILGVFLIGVIENGMNLMGVPSIYKDMVKGIIIIVAVAMDMANQPGTPLNNLKRRLKTKQA
ncbi:MAG: hypothetical protein IKD71_09380, partial [Solobacterium sp.]|nr:hypothetical protein [Solobacterium sp.]